LKGWSQGDRDIYVMINSYWKPLAFAIQASPSGTWARVIDTGAESPDDFREPGAEAVVTSAAYSVGPRSIVVLLDV
jgi:glycogen operon protein